MAQVDYLSSSPPPRIARMTASLLIAVFCFGFGFVSCVPLPTSVSAPFVLAPLVTPDPYRAPVSARVAEVYVTAGELVEQGQPLIALSSRQISADVSERASLALRLETLRSELERLDASETVELTALSSTLANRRHEESLAHAAFGAAEKEAANSALSLREAEGLADKGALSASQVRTAQSASQAAERSVFATERTLSRAASDRRQISAEKALTQARYANERARIVDELTRVRNGIADLDTHLQMVEHGQLVLRAACSGTIVATQVSGAGASVFEGEVLVQATCDRLEMRAELAMAQGGIGQIEVGMRVKLFYDTFPYQRYGVRYGTVSWVGPSADHDGQFSVFVQRSAADRPLPLKSGMGGRASVVTGRRTLLGSALEPLRMLQESTAMPPVEAASIGGT